MLAALGVLDEHLFHLINAVWTCKFLDVVMPAITDLNKSGAAISIGIAGSGCWIYHRRQAALRALAGLGLAVGAADLLSFEVIKPLVHRPRPEFSGIPVILRAGSHGRFGFPSNHAANCFAAAVFLGTLYPILSEPLLVLAALVAYSRVYVGAHFPFDVIGGALVGSLIGLFTVQVFKKWKIKGAI